MSNAESEPQIADFATAPGNGIKMDEVMAEIEATLAAEAVKPRNELSGRERKAFKDLYDKFSCPDYSSKRKGARGLPPRRLKIIWDLLKLPYTDQEIAAFISKMNPTGSAPEMVLAPSSKVQQVALPEVRSQTALSKLGGPAPTVKPGSEAAPTTQSGSEAAPTVKPCSEAAPTTQPGSEATPNAQPAEKTPESTTAPRLLTFDEMVAFRESQIKNRTKKDKLRQAFVTLSTDGERINFDELVGYITLGGLRSREEAERIALFAAFPDDPPLTRPPGELWVSVDACVKLYFTVRAKAENAGPDS